MAATDEDLAQLHDLARTAFIDDVLTHVTDSLHKALGKDAGYIVIAVEPCECVHFKSSLTQIESDKAMMRWMSQRKEGERDN